MPTPRGSAGSSSRRQPAAAPSRNKTGWSTVLSEKKKNDAARKRRDNSDTPYLEIKNKFHLKDGETATIQFINSEPYCVNGCVVPPGFDFFVTRKSVAKSCPMVDRGLKVQTRATFKLLDARGNYDKDKKEHKHDELVERYWPMSITVASQVYALSQRKGIPLNEMVLDVTRSGSDTKTTYNFEMALNKRNQPMEPEDMDNYEEVLPSLEDAFKPLDEDALIEVLGGGDDDDNDDDAARPASFATKRKGFK